MRTSIKQVILSKEDEFGYALDSKGILVTFKDNSGNMVSEYVGRLQYYDNINRFGLLPEDLSFIQRKAKELIKEPSRINEYLFDMTTGRWFKR